MDFSDSHQRAAFFDLHSGLPREGPGDPKSTARALQIARPLRPRPRVLDLACGPGMQTMDLATLIPDAAIVAVDAHRPFLDEVERRAVQRGCADRVRTLAGDMTKLKFEPGIFDLIWCEGAAYIMGVDNALNAWRPLLGPGGKVAFTEPVWLRADAPDSVRACWSEYPAMRDSEKLRELVRACGYDILGDFVLEEEAWWTYYYGPLQQRLELLASVYRGDRAGELVLEEARVEIETYRHFSAYYGYLFVVASPRIAQATGGAFYD
jgi:SAM-dependent methyltransferase